jgi:cytoskeleton protein RodZ
MTSIGETLRGERLRRNLDLDEISRELKISKRFLEAIEAEKFDKLPGGIFTKAFVRQYARLLGLDEEDLAAQVQRVLEPPPEVPQFAKRGKPAVSEIHMPRMEEWEALGERRFRWSSPLLALALVVAVMLVCSGVYAWWQRARHPASARESPPLAAETVQAPQPAPSTAPSTAPSEAAPAPPNAANPPASETAAPTPATGQPAAAPPLAPAPEANPNAAVRVQVTAEETVWVRALADGKYRFSTTLEAHQSRTVEANSMVELRLGNAGGVTILLNGNPVGAVGPRGQVRTVQFTSGGLQIVPVKPPGAPDPRF